MIFLNFFLQKRRWLISCLFIFISGCKSKEHFHELKLTSQDSAQIRSINKRAEATIKNAKYLIEQGDMILRTGNDFTSESLRQLSFTDKTFSHCGIASLEHDSIFVYHSLGGEWNPDEKMRRDPIELFCNPQENRGFGIFSFKMNSNQRGKLDSVVRSWYNKGVMFDMKFDLTTDDRLYCAEFVSKALSTATSKQISFASTKINNFEFTAIDNLFLNKNCKEKFRTTYK